MINPHKSLRAFRRAVKMRARKIMARSRSQLSSSEASTDSKEMFRKKRSVMTSSKNEDLNGEIRTKILGTFKVGILLKKCLRKCVDFWICHLAKETSIKLINASSRFRFSQEAHAMQVGLGHVQLGSEMSRSIATKKMFSNRQLHSASNWSEAITSVMFNLYFWITENTQHSQLTTLCQELQQYWCCKLLTCLTVIKY